MSTYRELRAAAEPVWNAWLRPSRPLITVGIATCANGKGAEDTLAALRHEVEGRGLDVGVGRTGCIGLCYEEPLVTVTWPDGTRVLYHRLTADRVPALLDEVAVNGTHAAEMALAVTEGQAPGVQPASELPFWKLQTRRLMEWCGVADPEDIDHYIGRGGYEGLDRALAMSQEDVIKEVLDSGLWGRGGAAFPAGRKWDFLRTARGEPKYLICNADEGDPGAFVNRNLMDSDPHLIIEGMVIAAHATGAAHGFIYIRDEYPLRVARMRAAVKQAYEKGLLGANVLGTDLSFDLEVVQGAGSYVCGEETGLIASIQDSRGMPRIKPPFPAQAGVFFKPTNVNNVETYANVPLIMRNGAAWYAEMGTEKNKGTKMFSLSGHIRRVGVLEVPFGMPMSRLLLEAGGGTPGDRPIKAIQPGGPLGGILPGHAVDLPLEPEPFREKGVLMGSGGLIVFDDTTCILDMVIYFSWFAEDESCGRCTTCHGGTQRMVEVIRRMSEGAGKMSDIDLLKLLSDTLRWSNCVHGQAAPTAMMNSLQYFMGEYEAHVLDKRCPAQVCRGLIRYEIDPAHSAQAEAAEEICPTGAVKRDDGTYYIDQALCIKCHACKDAAPEAVRIVDAIEPGTQGGGTPVGAVRAGAGWPYTRR